MTNLLIDINYRAFRLKCGNTFFITILKIFNFIYLSFLTKYLVHLFIAFLLLTTHLLSGILEKIYSRNFTKVRLKIQLSNTQLPNSLKAFMAGKPTDVGLDMHTFNSFLQNTLRTQPSYMKCTGLDMKISRIFQRSDMNLVLLLHVH